ncbi:MAG: hypothetical protein JM58_08370 [Peptococcaceae bacterium BICA1-8]|nr:MAG: hypothetical protein JM58_08370 [Peptococcaceae bacterium BICA1-8]
MYKSFEDMPVWQDSFNLADEIYDAIENFPKTEIYALSDQLRRASVSVSANIAEAFGRYHKYDKVKFYYYARGSLTETKSLLLFALKRQYIQQEQYDYLKTKINDITLKLNLVIKTLKNYQNP